MLDATTPHSYLHHASALGEFFLTSDSIVHSYRGAYANRIGALMEQIPPEHAAQVHNEGSTIGGYILFPGDVRDHKPTINGARGMNPRICDRFDLTVECIRRHYLRQDSPLAGTLDRYRDFFALFGDFGHYVEFFLLEDLVDADSGQLRWYLAFDDFNRSSLPRTLDEYETYRRAPLRFLRGRNERIREWAFAICPRTRPSKSHRSGRSTVLLSGREGHPLLSARLRPLTVPVAISVAKWLALSVVSLTSSHGRGTPGSTVRVASAWRTS